MVLIAAVELLHFFYVRPCRDLPVWDDANYFVSGRFLQEGRSADALDPEWTPPIQILAAVTWELPGFADPVHRFWFYSAAIHVLFVAGAYCLGRSLGQSSAVSACWALVLVITLGFLQMGEIYLFCAGCTMLILPRLLQDRPTGLVAACAWIAFLVLCRKESVLLTVPAAFAGVLGRRRAGFRWWTWKDAVPLLLLVAVLVPTVHASGQRRGFVTELNGGRFEFAFYQKFNGFCFATDHRLTRGTQDGDLVFERAFGRASEGTLTVLDCCRANPAVVLEFAQYNLEALWQDMLGLFGGRAGYWLTVFSLLGLPAMFVAGAVRRQIVPLLLAPAALATFLPLLLTQPAAGYVLPTLLLGWLGWMVALGRFAKLKIALSLGTVCMMTWAVLPAMRPTHPPHLPMLETARFLQRAARRYSAGHKVLAERYPQFSKAFGLPELDRTVSLDAVARDEHGVCMAGGSGLSVDWLLIQAPADFDLMPGEAEGARLLAEQGDLKLIAFDTVYRCLPGKLVSGCRVSNGVVGEQEIGGGQGSRLLWQPTDSGGTLMLDLGRFPTGDYTITLCLTHSWDYGIFDLQLNGEQLGPPLDLFAAAPHDRCHVFDARKLGSGACTLRAVNRDRNAESGGVLFGLNWITLRPVNSSPSQPALDPRKAMTGPASHPATSPELGTP